MSEIKLISVKELLENKEFFIPDYQRGYRWTQSEVENLLNDIWQFYLRKDKTKGEFYCLQPIVVKQFGDKYEVIDGQQRMTTIFLILRHLKGLIKDAFPNFSYRPPSYMTRLSSRDFLDNVENKTEEEANENIDFFHIKNAYNTIINWFKETNNNVAPLKFIDTLLYSEYDEIGDTAQNVRVIWYEISETENNSIDIFTRLNIGKIPLTNSELIKAMFLQKGNFTEENASLKQIQISSEWDTIEKKLQDDAFWYFIYSPSASLQYDNRIEYIFDLMKGREKESEHYHTFNEFSKDYTKNSIDNKWLEIKNYYLTIEEWYNDYTLFHHIGFLIDSGKDITSLIKEKETRVFTKIEFKRYLIDEIGMIFKNVDIDKLEYGNSNIKKTLLLFNIQTVLATQKSDMRFPFHKYKLDHWDIEHICSQTDKTINSNKRNVWIDDILEYFNGTNNIEDCKLISSDNETVINICNSLNKLKNSDKIDDDEFANAYSLVQKYFKEHTQIEEKDGISNLALLDANTNRSYGNSFFPIKRKRIIENDKNGIFVPIATKNLFLKYYSKKMGEIMYWSSYDGNDYTNAIKETLKEFLPNTIENEQ